MNSRGLILVMLLAMPAVGFGQTVYRCEVSGRVVFSDVPCAADAEVIDTSAAQRRGWSPHAVALVAQHEANEQARLEASARAAELAAMRPVIVQQAAADPPAQSWRCVSASGAVFYQHQPCPGHLRTNTRLGWTPVSGESISRGSACREIYGPGAGARTGSDLDAYEKLYGRGDACR